MAIFGWFIHYVVIFAALALIAGIGFFVGKKLSDRKSETMAEESKASGK